MIPWLKSPNLYAVIGILAVVVMIFSAGQNSERNKGAAEVAKVNVPIAEQRGQDEAQVPANEEAGKAAAVAVAGAVKQSLIINAETARLINNLR